MITDLLKDGSRTILELETHRIRCRLFVGDSGGFSAQDQDLLWTGVHELHHELETNQLDLLRSRLALVLAQNPNPKPQP